MTAKRVLGGDDCTGVEELRALMMGVEGEETQRHGLLLSPLPCASGCRTAFNTYCFFVFGMCMDGTKARMLVRVRVYGCA